MEKIRIVIVGVLFAAAVVIAVLGIVLHGYQEDFGSDPANTLPWAIPWTVATVVVGGLVVMTLFDAERRGRLSWFALSMELTMAGAFAVLWVSA